MTKELSLIGTGVGLGVVHVLTGPDHLSAIATLSANSDRWVAFKLGVGWGVGHSIGLLAVGIVFILITRASTADTVEIPEAVSTFFESLVGVFMILLGIYGIRRALEKNPEYGSVLDVAPSEVVGESEYSLGAEEGAMGEGGSSVEMAEVVGESEYSVGAEEGAMGQGGSVEVEQRATPSSHNHDHFASQAPRSPTSSTTNVVGAEVESPRKGCLGQIVSKISTRTMSLLAGMIHGLAGPGGVLGVIPAVQLHDVRLAAIYLGSFCLSSIFTMGFFALFYGTCSSNMGSCLQNGFWIEIVSASLSILVGILWIILISTGTMDQVFP